MKRAQHIAWLGRISGVVIAAAIAAAWGAVAAAQAQTGAPQIDVEGVRSSAGVNSVSPAGGTGVQAAVQQTSTYTILSYAPFGSMVEARSQKLTGAFSGENYFTVCSSAQSMVVTSTGVLCIYDPAQHQINCPAGLTGIHFTYTCTFIPTTENDLVRRGYAYTSGYNVDRVADVYFSPLIYVFSTLSPTLLEPGHLRWVQPDTPSLSATVTYRDQRVKPAYLPMIRRNS